MPKNRPRPPDQRTRSRDLLSRAETVATVTSVERNAEPVPRRLRGERVDAPTADMLSPPKTDWVKVGVWVATVTFVFGVVVTGVWNFADTVNSVRNLGDDVRDLKRRTDDLLRASLDVAARIASIERRPHELPLAVPPPTKAPSSPASK